MSLHVTRSHPKLKATLKKLGLLPAARWVHWLIMVTVNAEFRCQEFERRRLERAHRERFLQFKRNYDHLFELSLNKSTSGQKRVLIVGAYFPQVEIELGLIKGLEIAGFEPIVLITDGKRNLEYYKLGVVKEVIFLSEFIDPPDLAAAEALIEGFRSLDELQAFEYAGARVGRLAVSTALRALRSSSLDPQSSRDRLMIVKCVALSMATAAAAQKVLRRTYPDLALVWDGVYTPEGEFFDNCLANGIDVIIWESAHRSGSLMLKRYNLDVRGEHYASLSSASWKLLREMVWTGARREELQRELYGAYARGDWYSSAGTQFNKRFLDAESIRRKLGLDPTKKNAFVFPHIFWDGSLASGSDLFGSYEEWLVETVRAASANVRVNWVIKIHPAHVFKAMTDRYRGETAEAIVLRERIGELPPHVFMIPADSNISTLSMFDLMDYCLTVRGTIGIEAARLGIPVLTAGTGRYDHRGFTIDSDSRQEYLDKVARIQDIPRLAPAQREVAERFAYGLFVLRPFPLSTVVFEYREDHGVESGFERTEIKITKPEEWYTASDLKAFAQWVADSDNPDFLMPIPEK